METHDWPEWFFDDDISDEDRSRYLTQKRCQEQALNQKTPFARAANRYIKRIEQKQKAKSYKNGAVDVEEYR